MMGVKEPLSPEMEAGCATPATIREQLLMAGVTRTLCGLGWAHLRIN